MIENNEQWLKDGKCDICRRKNYCSKPCTKNKRRVKAEMYSLVHKYMNSITEGCYEKIIKNSTYGYIYNKKKGDI